MEKTRVYFQDAPFYKVPIWKMWIKLTDSLENSCRVVFNNILQYVYWGNKNKKKPTGIQIKLNTNPKEREKLIKFILSTFSLNFLPINYIEFVDDDLNTDYITLTQKCLIKSGMTYFTNSNTVFSALSNDINMQESGLVNTTSLLLQVIRKLTNINHRLYPYEIKEMEPITKPYFISGRKRKIDVDDTETNEINYNL